METQAPSVTLVNLGDFSLSELPFETYGRKMSFEVVKTDSENNLYTMLGVDEQQFTIFVETQASPAHGSFGRMSEFEHARAENPATFRSGMKAFLCLDTKKDNHHNHFRAICGQVNVATPNIAHTAQAIAFRDSKEHYDQLTATLTLSSSDATRPNIYISCRPEIIERAFGLSFTDNGNVKCLGNTFALHLPTSFYQRYGEGSVDFSLQTIANLGKRIKNGDNLRNLMLLLKGKEGMTGAVALNSQGIKKVLSQVFPFYARLLSDNEVSLLATFHTLVAEAKRTINAVKVAKFFNQFFADVLDYESFKTKLQQIYTIFVQLELDRTAYYSTYSFEDLFVKLPGYLELRKEALRSQSGRALTKMVQDIDAIVFDEAKFPLLAELIHDGSIPVSTFFRKEGDETYFLFNDNWAVFEQFLRRHREVGIELAKLASQRTTYEKSFMSYMYFVLYELPEYLEKHTGKPWTCFPKIVESTDELEPARGQVGQTTKKRSALTPIVDNENCTVVVPYACLKVSGVQTTYTYSLNYSVVRRGLSLEGSVSISDIEEKLNGRDDYGLMFYTLTGSVVGRGYPTFLIIFERLNGGQTRVHFHRTHPLRSKDGDQNPIHNWIRTCYNWMAGNINLGNIVAQQGDLVFVSVDAIPEGEVVLVDSYDQHVFARPVAFTPCTKKDAQNILGYFQLEQDTELNHAEHRTRTIPAGKYELRQCRSWEANPKGIWTLRID